MLVDKGLPERGTQNFFHLNFLRCYLYLYCSRMLIRRWDRRFAGLSHFTALVEYREYLIRDNCRRAQFEQFSSLLHTLMHPLLPNIICLRSLQRKPELAGCCAAAVSHLASEASACGRLQNTVTSCHRGLVRS